MAAKMPASVSYLVYYRHCMEGEFEQIMTKIRWSVKENNNYITAELQVLLTFISYFLQI